MKQLRRDIEENKAFLSSKFSSIGFLGKDTRTVDEIIADDTLTIERSGTDCIRIAGVLKEIYTKARDAFGGNVTVAPGLTAQFHESMGRIPSPFRIDGLYPKGEAVVTEIGRAHV